MATDATTQATEQTDVTTEKVTFTPEQQARVDVIVREAMGRAGREKAQEATALATKVTQLETDLAAAKAAQKTATTPGDKKAAKEDIEELQNRIQEMTNVQTQTQQEVERMKKVIGDKDKEVERAKADSLDVRKQVAIQDAAGDVGFVNVNIVSKLTSDQVKYDETLGRFIVYAENGQQRLNASYEPMSLKEFYAEFADKNPYLVRSDAKGGSGSSQSQKVGGTATKYALADVFGTKSNAALANKLAHDNYPEYKRMRVAAVEAGLLSA